MNANDWQARLISEIQQNTAKAALLLVVLVVAVYYWSPLLGRLWKKPGATPATPATQAAAGSPSDADSAAGFDWRAFVAWKERCEWMRPVAWSTTVANPFQSRSEGQLASKTEAVEPVRDEPPPLSQLGLELRSTLRGQRTRWANISGQWYAVGDTIGLADGVRSSGFRLLEVAEDHVLLERDGHVSRLELDPAGPPASGRLWITRSSR